MGFFVLILKIPYKTLISVELEQSKLWKVKVYHLYLQFVDSFFLEKNMLSFFLKILKQKCGSYVCVQLLQTLNILFENIRNETSLCELQRLIIQNISLACNRSILQPSG